MAKATRRSVRLLAVAALLAGLQMPLCVLACLDAADRAAVPMAEHHAASHCPGATPRAPAGATDSSRSSDPSDSSAPVDPVDPVDRHGDCRCDGSPAAVASWADAAPPALAAVTRPIVLPALGAHAHVRPATSSATDLPPPDLLLLNSTLLI